MITQFVFAVVTCVPLIAACVMLFVWGARWRRRAKVATALLRSSKSNGAAPRRAQPMWRCTVCGQMHAIAELAQHEHRDDPRSAYYEPPKAES